MKVKISSGNILQLVFYPINLFTLTRLIFYPAGEAERSGTSWLVAAAAASEDREFRSVAGGREGGRSVRCLLWERLSREGEKERRHEGAG
ncbi:hypothetical protein E2C01_058488 [Portunus trituberculatus]|uniref:Uncharacterized protein n=1 Tax=Portunus trituberculatus TaxID=210409 RepID=A0A5B7H696_PORTR|nr:hypothetical protein [Portunus trituberculatus]